MFEQSFKNIDNILRTDSGCSSAIDYIEQTSWVLFLKYLDDLESTKKMNAELSGKEYKYILKPEFSWNAWVCPKTEEEKDGISFGRKRKTREYPKKHHCNEVIK